VAWPVSQSGSVTVEKQTRWSAHCQQDRLSAYSEAPEGIAWFVDESITKSELPEGLLPIIERAHRLAPPSTGRIRHRGSGSIN